MRCAILLCMSSALAAPAFAEDRDWSGAYIGVSAGYGWGDNRVADDNPDLFYRIEPGGLIAGGQIGYNLQIGGWVVGVEADATIGDLDRRMAPGDSVGAFDEVSIEVDYLASIRLRAGLTSGQALYYATGGVGFAAWTDRNFVGGVQFGDGLDHSRTGWTLGAGIEYAVDARWTAKFEYLHYGFGDETLPPTTFWYIGSDHFETSFDTVKFGLNFRF